MLLRPIDVFDHQAALELLALQIISYEIEAKRIGFEQAPPLSDSFQTLQRSKETFIGCYEEEKLIGAASFKESADEATICRMMVHPDHFRRGVATMLLLEMERRIDPHLTIHVPAGTRNEPAMSLYLKHGYVPENEVLVARGITITMLVKCRSAGRQEADRRT